MKLGRCPICHSHIQLEALIQDDAGSELLGLLASATALRKRNPQNERGE